MPLTLLDADAGHRSGRSVPISSQLRSHRLFSENWERLAYLVDAATLYHTGVNHFQARWLASACSHWRNVVAVLASYRVLSCLPILMTRCMPSTLQMEEQGSCPASRSGLRKAEVGVCTCRLRTYNLQQGRLQPEPQGHRAPVLRHTRRDAGQLQGLPPVLP